jgi:glutamyl-tRNA synthetase/nondiscriminating glutamyl-tRNA synthetase
VSFNTDIIGDPIIIRSDGRPAYNFAVVIDDALMEITHVVRGEDHISNTPRQILIYEALGFAQPRFAHLSLVLGPDHAPLSKRHGATSVAEFRAHGYLPEALVNYLAILGWSPGEGREIIDVREMARRFEVQDVSRSAAVFDPPKLAWMNRHYMKDASPARIARLSFDYFARAGFAEQPSEAAMNYLMSILPMAEAGGAAAIRAMSEEVGDAPLDRDTFREAAGRARQKTGLKGRALFHPLRVALTAEGSGPELDLAVPAIDRGAALPPGSGIPPIVSCADRLRAIARLLE